MTNKKTEILEKRINCIREIHERVKKSDQLTRDELVALLLKNNPSYNPDDQTNSPSEQLARINTRTAKELKYNRTEPYIKVLMRIVEDFGDNMYGGAYSADKPKSE